MGDRDGHDGDHYAADVINLQFLEANKFKCKGGGGIRIDQRHGEINHGNGTIIDFFCMLRNEGTAHGIHHYAEDVGGPVAAMNLNTYWRPQVNTSLDSGTGQHVLKKEEVNGGTVMKNGIGRSRILRKVLHFDALLEEKPGNHEQSSQRVGVGVNHRKVSVGD